MPEPNANAVRSEIPSQQIFKKKASRFSIVSDFLGVLMVPILLFTLGKEIWGGQVWLMIFFGLAVVFEILAHFKVGGTHTQRIMLILALVCMTGCLFAFAIKGLQDGATGNALLMMFGAFLCVIVIVLGIYTFYFEKPPSNSESKDQIAISEQRDPQ